MGRRLTMRITKPLLLTVSFKGCTTIGSTQDTITLRRHVIVPIIKACADVLQARFPMVIKSQLTLCL